MKSSKLLIITSLIFLLCCSSVEAKGWKQKEFIIAVWCPPPATAANMKSLANDHYNLVNVEFWNDPTGPLVDPTELLNVAGQNGMKAMLYSLLITSATLDNPAQKAKLDDLIDKAKNNSALEAYFVADEPQSTAFPALLRLVNYIKQRDPDHLAYVNLYPSYANQQQLGVDLKEAPKGPIGIPDNYAGIGTNADTVKFYGEYLRQYINVIKPELISYDHYNFMNNGIDGQQYFLNLALIRNAAVRANLPFLNIVQSCQFDPGWRKPTGNEMRWLAFTTLAYGGRGICWFVYWGNQQNGAIMQDGTRSSNADQVAAINKDISAIGTEMLQMTSTAVYHVGTLPIGTESIPVSSPVKVSKGEYIIGLFKQNGEQNIFMVMNRNYKNASTVKVTLDYDNGKLMEYSPNQKKWTDVQFVQQGTTFTTVLRPGDGKLYRIDRK